MYCVSCRMPARSARKLALPRSSSEACSARLAVATTTGSSSASTRWLSVCPSGTSRGFGEAEFVEIGQMVADLLDDGGRDPAVKAKVLKRVAELCEATEPYPG